MLYSTTNFDVQQVVTIIPGDLGTPENRVHINDLPANAHLFIEGTAYVDGLYAPPFQNDGIKPHCDNEIDHWCNTHIGTNWPQYQIFACGGFNYPQQDDHQPHLAGNMPPAEAIV